MQTFIEFLEEFLQNLEKLIAAAQRNGDTASVAKGNEILEKARRLYEVTKKGGD